jgi:HlyD family secretion protein
VNRSRWVIVGIVVIAVAAVIVWRARPGSEAPKYRTAAIERGTIQAVVSATGTVRPVVQVEVGSQVSGTVYRIHADYNSRVTAGEVLCEIEPSALRARVVQNQAAVAKAEVAVKDAQRVLRRANELVKQDYISQAEVEADEVAVERSQADLRQARAQLEVTEVDLKNSVIRAPIDGVVIARSIDLGQTVAASLQAPKLFVIANDLAQMQVETRIDEADIGRIHAGLPVTFTVDAYPDDEFQGEVAQVRLEPIVDQGVVTYTTVIKTGNPGLRLKPGMTANVSVQVARRDDVLRIPTAALRFRPATRGGADAAMASKARGGERGAGVVAMSGGGGHGQSSAGGTGDGARVWKHGVPGTAEAEPRPPDPRAAARGGDDPARGPHGAPDGWARGTGASGAAGVAGSESAGGAGAPSLKPGAIFILRDGKLERVPVMTGLTDGTAIEIRSEQLKAGDLVVVGLESSARGNNLQPPPGMGGPFMGPGPGRGGGRR